MTEFSLSRRRFALGAAAATAAIALPAGVVPAMAAEEQATSAAAPKPAPVPATLEQQAQEAFAKLSASAKAEVEMKFQNLLRKYGDKLSAEQKTDVRKALAESQQGLEAMRAFVLANGDQPAAVFHIYRGEGKK
jgi:ABC-type Fe2+-enterobactin transport system substrate-binding protein